MKEGVYIVFDTILPEGYRIISPYIIESDRADSAAHRNGSIREVHGIHWKIQRL
jgi:hypothetical protein